MIPYIYQIDITLHEATFFASHELDAYYFTEPILGNYALAYALGWVNSPYNRYHVGYAEDIPALNDKGLYITPAWPTRNPTYRIERFNCQSESYKSGMTNNAVIEASGRQNLVLAKGNRYKNSKTQKTIITATNRPQTGIIKFLQPHNQFQCHVISTQKCSMPRYIRLGKFMSKAKLTVTPLTIQSAKTHRATYPVINPIDLDNTHKLFFGDMVNIHPSPLVRQADIEGQWWIDTQLRPIVPSLLSYKGL